MLFQETRERLKQKMLGVEYLIVGELLLDVLRTSTIVATEEVYHDWSTVALIPVNLLGTWSKHGTDEIGVNGTVRHHPRRLVRIVLARTRALFSFRAIHSRRANLVPGFHREGRWPSLPVAAHLTPRKFKVRCISRASG